MKNLSKTMEDSIFNNLMKNATCENWCLGEIYFDATWGGYQIVFGQDHNGNPIIDLCGNDLSGVYVDNELSKEQKKVIFDKVSVKIEEVRQEVDKEEVSNGAFTLSDYIHFDSLIR